MKKYNILKLLTLLIMFTALSVPAAFAATTGDLVNTESFFIIDDGDGTTDLQLQFGDALGEILEFDVTSNRFEFSDDLYIQGNLDVEGESLSINADGTASDSSIDFNQGVGSLQYNTVTDDFTFSDDVNVIGNIDQTGSIFLLDSDDTGGDVGIQFGTTLAEVISWDSTNSRFNVSDDLYIAGALEVNGDIDFNQNMAIEMVIDQGTSFPGTPTEGQTFYRTDLDTFYIYDGSSWVAMADVSGANAMFVAPLYPNATYYGDGSNNVGRLTYYFDNTNVENAYRWQSTSAALQDYDLKIRIQVPDNFSSWDASTPIEFKYRTDTILTADNQLDLTMLDSADTSVTMGNNTALKSSVAATWVESTNMTVSGGTWTAGGWFTITIKSSAKSTGGAEAGSIVLNYNTSN